MGRVELNTHPFQSLRGRNVFVTGHTGFKGSWLAMWMSRLGANVYGYALPPETTPNNFEVSGVGDVLADHTTGDIRDAEKLTAALQAADPEIVFHLAAQPLVRRSYRQPRETLDVNVIGTASLLDAVRQFAQPCVVIVVTSDKCYAQTDAADGCRETDALGGSDPYSASKASAELVANSYRQAFFSPEKFADHGVQLASVRAGNVIGGGDWAEDRIMTDVVAALQSGQPVQLRNPHSVRPWQHVLDALSGYLCLSERMQTTLAPELATAWNFGPSQALRTVQAVVEAFVDAWGFGSWECIGTPSAWSEAQTLTLNTDKARRELGWRPVWDFDETIRRTAGWYRRFAEHGSGACLADISAWESAWLNRKPLPTSVNALSTDGAVPNPLGFPNAGLGELPNQFPAGS